MDTAISDDIRSDSKLYPMVRSANDVLQSTVGQAPSPPRAVWRMSNSNGTARQIELELVYHDESITRRFVSDELSDSGELRYRLSRLWENLLIASNGKTTDRLLDIFREWRREAELQEN